METIFEIASRNVTADDIDTLGDAVRDMYRRVVDADPDPRAVAAYLTDPAQQAVATAAVSGGGIPRNTDHARALLGALRTLQDFYDAELCGC